MSSVIHPAGLLPTHQRLPLYDELALELASIERTIDTSSCFYRFSILGAKLHLQSFYLFDEPSSDNYVDRILKLYITAATLIQHTISVDRDSPNFLRYSPWPTAQIFIAATFIILKIIRNDYLSSFVDLVPGRELFYAAMGAIQLFSVARNDLPSKFAAVLQVLATTAPAEVIGGHGQDGLRLAVRSRDSMSVVFDSLWRWREHCHNQTTIFKEEGQQQQQEEEGT